MNKINLFAITTVLAMTLPMVIGTFVTTTVVQIATTSGTARAKHVGPGVLPCGVV
ncbi:MAG TPA: hypothetical protein VFG45_13055 [Candidatus Nitrosocosmicus sp.]|nr:hypothetical protein [Candidatus Nitrosocosmicus sp.]